MKRILIVGISGTGKSRLARRLSEQTGISVTHCDAIAWKPVWQPEDPKVVSAKLDAVLDSNEWIMEGYIRPRAAKRVAKADCIIYLDYPGYLALLGGFKRWQKYRGRERPEMQTGNKEDFAIKNFYSMFTRRERPEIESYLIGSSKKVIRLKSWTAANKFQL